MVLNHPPKTFINFHVLNKQSFAVFAATSPDGKRNEIVILLASPNNTEARFSYLANATARDSDLTKLRGHLDRLGWLELQDSSGCVVNLSRLKDHALSVWEVDPQKNIYQICMSLPALKNSMLSLQYSNKKARASDYEALLGAIGSVPGKEEDEK